MTLATPLSVAFGFAYTQPDLIAKLEAEAVASIQKLKGMIHES